MICIVVNMRGDVQGRPTTTQRLDPPMDDWTELVQLPCGHGREARQPLDKTPRESKEGQRDFSHVYVQVERNEGCHSRETGRSGLPQPLYPQEKHEWNSF